MKVCPICHTSFTDEAESCPQCKALLEEKKPEPPTDKKRLFLSLLYMLLFILFMMGAITLLVKVFDLV